MQAFAVALDQGLHHALGRSRLSALQLAKHHAGNAWVLGHELDMAHEHRLQGRKGRLDALCGPVNSGQQTVCHPLHDGLPNGLFVRKVPKQRTLGQVHVLGDGRRGDLAGVL